jgi:outer membrane lipoprotein-sorting protein
MIEKNPESFSDIVDRAAEELRAMPVPPGPPPELLDTLLQAASASDRRLPVAPYNQPLSHLQKIRNIIMKYPFKSLTTFAACCIVLIAAYLIVGPMTHGSVAFAELAAIIQNAKTMVCTAQTNISLPGATGNTNIKIMSIGPGRIREEMGKQMVLIFDYPAGKSLTLIPQAKTAVVLNIKGVSKYMQQDWFAGLKMFAQNSGVEDLGLQTLEGREVKGFRMKGNPTYTCWVDPKSGNPIKVEVHGTMIQEDLNNEGKRERTMDMVMSDFQFDVPLDESLFSLTPPEGYKLQQELNMDYSNPSEKDVIEVLRRYADMENGAFPDSLTDQNLTIRITLEPMRQIEKQNKTEAEKKALEKEMFKTIADAGSICTRMSLFLLENAGWSYAGKGLKLGDANRPIFWYVPKDSKQGRVVYGDLSVRNVPLDKLPAVPAEKNAEDK